MADGDLPHEQSLSAMKDLPSQLDQLDTVEAGLQDAQTSAKGTEGGDEGAPSLSIADLHFAPEKKKKSKKSKPKSKRGLNAPTGFEPFHADGPLTAEQMQEDASLYDPDLPFTDRILTCIQRFERTRRLVSERRNVFYKYLAYGGISVTDMAFQSSLADPETMDKDQVAASMARASINSNRSNEEFYVVDFEGVMKGFLSRRTILYHGMETREQVELVTVTLERFMDYILQHDVCPEYRSAVIASRQICRQATDELWCCAQAQRWLPGDFNIGCSTLFGGQYCEDYDGESSWDPETTGFVGMSADVAMEVVKFGAAAVADDEEYEQFLDMATHNTLAVIEVKSYVGFEITQIEPVTDETVQLYKKNAEKFRPVGRIFAKPWVNLDAAPRDLNEEEHLAEAMLRQSNIGDMAINELTDHPFFMDGDPSFERTYTFFIPESTLTHLYAGMKVEATVHKLNCGIWFFDRVVRCYVSFDTWLVGNECGDEWKEPRPHGKQDAQLLNWGQSAAVYNLLGYARGEVEREAAQSKNSRENDLEVVVNENGADGAAAK